MGIREDFSGYIDGNGLYAPNPTSPTGQGSDNGPMYTSEVIIMISKRNLMVPEDKDDYAKKISSCIIDGLLNRAPYKTGQTGPDDHYGVYSACQVLGITEIPKSLFKGMLKYWGFMNNENPGQKTAASFLPRQPQLVAAMVASAYPSKLNPKDIAMRALFAPCFWWASLVIATSCIDTPVGDTDSRRLSWHLIQATKPVSILCWLASKIWYKRLAKDYKNGMNDVAAIYYQPHDPSNPYAKYWVG